MSLTASMPGAVVGELDVGEDQARTAGQRLLHGLVARHGDAGDIMAEVADDRLDIHRDDRLVLDDQHVGAGLPLDLRERFGHQILDLVGRRADQIAGILGREALHRGQQQRLSRQRRDPREPRLGDPFAASASAWPGCSSIFADDQIA